MLHGGDRASSRRGRFLSYGHPPERHTAAQQTIPRSRNQPLQAQPPLVLQVLLRLMQVSPHALPVVQTRQQELPPVGELSHAESTDAELPRSREAATRDARRPMRLIIDASPD